MHHISFYATYGSPLTPGGSKEFTIGCSQTSRSVKFKCYEAESKRANIKSTFSDLVNDDLKGLLSIRKYEFV